MIYARIAACGSCARGLTNRSAKFPMRHTIYCIGRLFVVPVDGTCTQHRHAPAVLSRSTKIARSSTVPIVSCGRGVRSAGVRQCRSQRQAKRGAAGAPEWCPGVSRGCSSRRTNGAVLVCAAQQCLPRSQVQVPNHLLSVMHTEKVHFPLLLAQALTNAAAAMESADPASPRGKRQNGLDVVQGAMPVHALAVGPLRARTPHPEMILSRSTPQQKGTRARTCVASCSIVADSIHTSMGHDTRLGSEL